jgi:hypothetical protein
VALGGPASTVATAALFLERLHRDPVEFARQAVSERARLYFPIFGQWLRGVTEGSNPGARPWRIDFTKLLYNFLRTRAMQRFVFERKNTGQQFIENHAERIDVGAGVDSALGELGLFGAHVLRRADDGTDLSEHR